MMDRIPPALVAKPGVIKQLQDTSAQMSSTALGLIDTALDYRAKASDPRLGISPTNLNTNLLKANAAKRASSSTGFGLGHSIVLERAAKKKDFKSKLNIRIDVYLFQHPRRVKGKQGNMTEVMLFIHRDTFTTQFRTDT
jgi:hypothetical protein